MSTRLLRVPPNHRSREAEGDHARICANPWSLGCHLDLSAVAEHAYTYRRRAWQGLGRGREEPVIARGAAQRRSPGASGQIEADVAVPRRSLRKVLALNRQLIRVLAHACEELGAGAVDLCLLANRTALTSTRRLARSSSLSGHPPAHRASKVVMLTIKTVHARTSASRTEPPVLCPAGSAPVCDLKCPQTDGLGSFQPVSRVRCPLTRRALGPSGAPSGQ